MLKGVNKYGVKYPSQRPEVQEKIKQNCFAKYGVEYHAQRPDVIKKIKDTCIDKYGVEHLSHCPEIMEKMSKNVYKIKEYIFPSGRIERVQGTEPHALNKLIYEEGIDENDIVVGSKNVPEIWYYDECGKKHRHYVDIFINSQNRCIESKSTWTAEKKQDNIFLKQNAGKELGYVYEIFVFDRKNTLVNIYK